MAGMKNALASNSFVRWDRMKGPGNTLALSRLRITIFTNAEIS